MEQPVPVSNVLKDLTLDILGIVMEYFSTVHSSFIVDFNFRNNITILMGNSGTGKTAAFFFITSGGLIQVRAASDYVSKMIGLAGGKYVFDDLGGEDSGRSTVNIQMEDFYKAARDADVLIYNSAIDGGVSSLEELVEKSGLLADFKAVKEGNIDSLKSIAKNIRLLI